MNTEHIIFRAVSSDACCRHCGDCYRFKLPIPVLELARLIDAFTLLHADCKEQAHE